MIEISESNRPASLMLYVTGFILLVLILEYPIYGIDYGRTIHGTLRKVTIMRTVYWTKFLYNTEHPSQTVSLKMLRYFCQPFQDCTCSSHVRYRNWGDHAARDDTCVSIVVIFPFIQIESDATVIYTNVTYVHHFGLKHKIAALNVEFWSIFVIKACTKLKCNFLCTKMHTC